jgi:hypothetical protein
MKRATRAWLLALTTLGAAGASWGQAETYRCPQGDGSILFQATPCPLAQLATPEPATPAPVPAAATPPRPAASVAAAPAKPKPLERSVITPAPVMVPAPLAGLDASQDDGFVKPTKRKRDILELSAQFERCRADVPGFAEKSAPVYTAWTQRHAAVLAEYHKLLTAKVRAGRRGEMTLPLQVCTDAWLHDMEPLTRTPDARFQTVEKTWQVFLGALMTGDRTALLNCLAGRAAARWQERALQLSDEDMRRMAGSIRGLKVQWGDDYEKEGLVADNDNRVAGIAFRNINEEWKITDLGASSTIAQPAAKTE